MRYVRDKWRIENLLVRAGEHRLKFTDTPDWTGRDWGQAEGFAGSALESTGGKPDVSFVVRTAGLFHVEFDVNSGNYAIHRSDRKTQFDALYVGGTFSDWRPAAMTFTEGAWVLAEVEMRQGTNELKFGTSPDWTGEDWGHAEGLSGSVEVTTGGGSNVVFVAPVNGAYDVRFSDLSLAYEVQLRDGGE